MTAHPRIACALLALGLGMASSASAQSGVQISPDRQRTLVSKDVGGLRWAITRNAEDGTVTGNVFARDGGDPQFVWCEERGSEGADVLFGCFGADRCPLTPCGGADYTFIAEVALSETFFAPRPVPRAASAQNLQRATGSASSGSGSGVQQTRDDARVLISKDVGKERWAITRHLSDGSVTGNVFITDREDPSFVFCEQIAEDGDDIEFTCFGTERCDVGGCPEWTFIANARLPASFFAAPQSARVDEVAAAGEAVLGRENATLAALLAFDAGYSLGQVARALLTGQLRADGSVTMRSGEIERPAGPALGLILAEEPELARAAATAPISVADLEAILLSRGIALHVVLELVQKGYTAEQALLGTLAGNVTYCSFIECPPELRGGGAVLAGQNGKAEKPGADPQPVLDPRRANDSEFCGNGQIDPGEDCDPHALPAFRTGDTGPSCSFGDEFLDGQFGCDEQTCAYDASPCIRDLCGNGRLDVREQCDETDAGPVFRDSPPCAAAECSQICTIVADVCSPTCEVGGSALGRPQQAGCPVPTDPFPWTYRGTAQRTLRWTANYGGGGTRTLTDPTASEVVVRADGTITGTFRSNQNITIVCPSEEALDNGDPARFLDASGGEGQFDGTHLADGTFEIAVSPSLPPIQGTFTAEALSGSLRSSQTVDVCPSPPVSVTIQSDWDLNLDRTLE